MIPELDGVFKKYEALVEQVDDVFRQVKEKYGELVACKLGCADCCHALFDLSLVEALYINRSFLEKATENRRCEVLEIANKADRMTYQLKRKAFKSVSSGEKSEEQVLLEMAAQRVRCPLLNDEDRCVLYEHRPITCRLYGIPTSIGGRGHTCGLSGFSEGESYPTVNIDAINGKLQQLSHEIVSLIKSRHVKMGEVLMPLSMALLTVFDEEYLGLKSEEQCSEKKEEKGGGNG